ncbi:protein phosphatase regulator [Malassezia sp. CBS 17886]|nr:protein phosphatase regulator [Malassezia sp. CBS 17886]
MDEQIAQFLSLADVPEDVARAYVEGASGDLNAALEAFYEGGAPTAPSAPSSGPRTLHGAAAQSADPWPSESPPSSRASSHGPRGPRHGGVMTFSDLRSEEAGGMPHGGSDGGDDDPVNLFAGGERSGLNVENPERARRGAATGNSIVNDILTKASTASQAAAAREPSSFDLRGSRPSADVFSGRGYSIGGETVGRGEAEEDTESMPGDMHEDDEESEEAPAVRHLTFWQEGFSIEDGPLHRYDDPANEETLEAINAGRAPLSLLNVRFGQPVELMVSRRTHEKYEPPPPPPQMPFGGHGNRLGSVAPGVRAAGATAAPANAPPAPTNAEPEVDPSQPTTQIQVRLSDGQRLVAKVNTNHTVSDLRRIIDARRPDLANYTLHTSFPPKAITDEHLTVADAGLKNAVVVVKLT